MSETVPSSIEPISNCDWAQTLDSVKRYLLGRIEQLERQYEELKAENAMLREQLGRNSQNLSTPPSQDQRQGFKPKAKQAKQAKQAKGKARGAQFGHIGHEPKFYPLKACETVEEHYPKRCIDCEAWLQGKDPDPYRVQQVEIPAVLPVVREHRFHARACACCGVSTRAWDEAVIGSRRYGERVAATVGILNGQYRQSHRMVQGLLDQLFGVEISLGSINQLRQESSASVAAAVAEAHPYV
jgi:transposase